MEATAQKLEGRSTADSARDEGYKVADLLHAGKNARGGARRNVYALLGGAKKN